MTTPMHIYENVTLRCGDPRTSASRRRTAGLSLMMSLCTQTLRTSTETETGSWSQIKGSWIMNLNIWRRTPQSQHTCLDPFITDYSGTSCSQLRFWSYLRSGVVSVRWLQLFCSNWTFFLFRLPPSPSSVSGFFMLKGSSSFPTGACSQGAVCLLKFLSIVVFTLQHETPWGDCCSDLHVKLNKVEWASICSQIRICFTLLDITLHSIAHLLTERQNQLSNEDLQLRSHDCGPLLTYGGIFLLCLWSWFIIFSQL